MTNTETHLVTHLGWDEITQRIKTRLPEKGLLYGVPRGGSIVAGLTGRAVDSPEQAHYIIDDIIDSGRTRDYWKTKFPEKKFFALVDKTNTEKEMGWVHFPWETAAQQDIGESVVRLLQFLGENPNREGLRDTPRRVVKAWQEMTVGYHQKPADVLKVDFDGGGYDQILGVPWIEFTSTCEHHLIPFLGHAHVAYLPGSRVVGLSKLGRLVDIFARRLQIQEQLTKQIADAIEEHLKPKGVAVVISARHMCMASRGVQKRDSSMVTSAMTGVFRENAAARAEFFQLVEMAPKPW